MAKKKPMTSLEREGDAAVQYNLGHAYSKGTGVQHDAKEAEKWYRLAAAQGFAKAQYNLGVMFSNSTRNPSGVDQDFTEAVKWYRLAAAQGLKEAQFNLGLRYHNGEGVDQDTEEAFKWYRLAAAQGLAEAQNTLDGYTPGIGQFVYSWLSSILFAACAYAQLNDPDPELWVALYLGGGSFLTYYQYRQNSKMKKDNDDAQRSRVVSQLVMYVMVYIALGARLGLKLWPMMQEMFAEHSTFSARGWAFLEFEEGREVGGLIMLLLHTLQLFTYVPGKTGGPGSGTVRILSNLLSAFVMTSLATAVWMWYWHQPMLNTGKYAEEHCDGMFDGSDHAATDGDKGTSNDAFDIGTGEL